MPIAAALGSQCTTHNVKLNVQHDRIQNMLTQSTFAIHNFKYNQNLTKYKVQMMTDLKSFVLLVTKNRNLPSIRRAQRLSFDVCGRILRICDFSKFFPCDLCTCECDIKFSVFIVTRFFCLLLANYVLRTKLKLRNLLVLVV